MRYFIAAASTTGNFSCYAMLPEGANPRRKASFNELVADAAARCIRAATNGDGTACRMSGVEREDFARIPQRTMELAKLGFVLPVRV